ncbi:MAG: uracil-DNA glycosylase [Spirochaetaceae bacterium]|nr:uracil-DNA glycosylase [Spirochaetaceae bacterium]
MTIKNLEDFTENKIEAGWLPFFEDELSKPYFTLLFNKVKEAYNNSRCYPAKTDIFKAFNLTPYQQVKGLLLGQDPYHTGVATGLAFSVDNGVPPPSLKNVYDELKLEGYTVERTGNLEGWAQQGLLMLNSVLTVQAGKAASHSGLGWQQFSDNLISYLNQNNDNIFYFLWGNYAKAKAALVTNPSHSIFTATHPSPLAGTSFLRNGCFNKANQFLTKIGKEPLDWSATAKMDKPVKIEAAASAKITKEKNYKDGFLF